VAVRKALVVATDGELEELPAGDSLGALGEANTASNLGTGQGVWVSKTEVNLNFKSLKAGSGVTLSSNATEITINSTGGGGGGNAYFPSGW
jgi:hypothetical protein